MTPAKYAEILSDTERFIHKAVFSPVQTKSGFGNAFTVSPKRVTYCEGAPIPFLQASFELDDESAAVLLNTPYTVSYSIEDKDGVHGAATAFVTISHEKVTEPEVTDGLSAVTKEYTCECGAMYYVTCMNPGASQPGEATSTGNYWVPVEESFWWNEWNVEIVENGDKVFFPYYENTTHTRMYFECSCGRTKQYCSSDFYTQPTPTPPHIIPHI